MAKHDESIDPGDMSPEERAYLEALERNVAAGRQIARNPAGSKHAGGRTTAEIRAGLGGGGKPAAPAAAASAGAPPRIDAAAMYPIGAILALGDGSIGIYKDPAHGKEYQLVYFLEPDGRIAPQGVVLHAYDVKELGVLPDEFLRKFQQTQRWNRDAVVFHLRAWEDVKFLPPAVAFDASTAPAVGGVSPQHGSRGSVPMTTGEFHRIETGENDRVQTVDLEPPHPHPEQRDVLITGRRLRVKFGDRDWEAVYWGHDELGPILAHSTNKKWALMHLDLKRFGDNIEYLDVMTRDQIAEVLRQVEAGAGH